jgi:hypothetical protein
MIVARSVAMGAPQAALPALQQAVRVGLGQHRGAYVALMRALGERGDVAGVVATYAALLDNHVRPCTETGRVLIGVLEQHGRDDLAADVREEFRRNGIVEEI